MPLLLRIENMDSLPDGGPLTFELDRRGIDIGRDPYLDWTLPDAERYISGKHAEVRYRDGGYWLHDVSTNGTSINGRGGRLTEPYRLADGDRIHIGQYIIAVGLSGDDVGQPAQQQVGAASGGDPWGGIADSAAAVDRRDFAARPPADDRPPQSGPADLAEENISWSVGEISRGDAPAEDIWGAPPEPAGPAGKAADDWGWSPPAGASRLGGPPAPAADPFAPPSEAATPAPEPAPFVPAPPAAEQSAMPTAPAPGPAEPAAAPEEAASAAAERAAPADEPPARQAAPSGLAGRWAGGDEAPAAGPASAAAAPASTAGAGGFVAAFERGAGVPAGAVSGRSDEAFAEELGALFRLVTQNLQAMLAARAETKSAMRSSERTMIGALENNPLKFSPTPEDAMRIMFGAKSRSYLGATQTIEQSFGDLQTHQLQTFGAMQQALQALIEDLDPKNIEDATSKDGGLAGIVGSRRAKFWDTYVERFRAKSARHERGMIDAFMILFAEMYDRQG